MFNTLSYTKKLEEAGVLRQQAEAHVQIIAEIIEGDMATKSDLKDLQNSMTTDLKDFKASMTADMKDLNDRMIAGFERVDIKFATLRSEVKNDMAQLEYRLIIKIGVIVTIVISAVSAILKYI